MQNTRELHIFIAWEKARSKEKFIRDEITKEFELCDIYDIQWSKERFSKNLTRFYGKNLPKNSNKEKHIGNGRFLLFIVMDNNPCYENRKTSKGEKLVNINTFDLKEKLRISTGGGHKIHATNSSGEVDHDLSLLLGINSKDYVNKYKKFDGSVKLIEKDLIGCEGWKSLQELFYTLNNTVNYVILRNFEDLPNCYDNKSDIDILTDGDLDDIKNLCLSKPKYFGNRLHYITFIQNKEIILDFSTVGDGFYDDVWQKSILYSKILYKNIFYKPSDLDYFYSLIYHAIIHKRSISEDYFCKILKLAEKNNLKATINNKLSIYKILEDYLLKSNYLITKPEDHSVYFNGDNIDIYSLIKHLEKEFKFDYIEFFLEKKWQKNIFSMLYFVGYKGKKKFFIKVSKSKNQLIEREAEVIRYLSSEDIEIPKLIANCKYKNFSILIENFIDGGMLTKLLSQKSLSKDNIKKIILSIKKIIKVFHKKKLIHRDIRPDNLIFHEGKLFLIDFSFVLDQNQEKFPELNFIVDNLDKIKNLGDKYALGKLIWDDVFSCKTIIKEMHPKYKRKFFKEYMFFNRKIGKIRISYKSIRYRFIRRIVKIIFFIASKLHVNKDIILNNIKNHGKH